MEPKELFREFLKKFQKLQLEAFDAGLCMEISSRDTNTDSPWLSGYVNIEGCNFVEDTEGSTYINIHLHPYTWRSEKDNRDDALQILAKARTFINKFKK